MKKTINLVGVSREDLLVIADRACCALVSIANNLTTDEGDREETEEEIGLSFGEVVEMAHDDMIGTARSALDSIIAAQTRAEAGRTALED